MSEGKKKIDSVGATGLILEHLMTLENEGKRGQTIYGLRSKAFRNSQRDERIKNLVEKLVKSGYVESFLSGEDKTLYVITDKGRNFYKDSVKKVMDLFREDI
ncbi:MAG: hypothetical protein QXU18_14680 [Thermoplasmatales archaeon]